MAEREDPAREEDESEPAVAPPSRGRDQAVWVGFFLVVGIIAIFAALFILTDAAFFRGRYIVSTVVTDAGGIRRGDPVQMRGVNIGRVQRFKIAKDNVEIRLELEGEYKVPKDSHVELKSGGLLGGTIAEVVPGDSPEYLHNGDHVDGRMVPGLFDAANRVAGQVEKVMGQVEKLMTDTTVKNISGTADNAQVATRDLRKLIADVSTTVAEQRKTLATLEASLQRSAGGLEKVATGPELDRALKRLEPRFHHAPLHVGAPHPGCVRTRRGEQRSSIIDVDQDDDRTPDQVLEKHDHRLRGGNFMRNAGDAAPGGQMQPLVRLPLREPGCRGPDHHGPRIGGQSLGAARDEFVGHESREHDAKSHQQVDDGSGNVPFRSAELRPHLVSDIEDQPCVERDHDGEGGCHDAPRDVLGRRL